MPRDGEAVVTLVYFGYFCVLSEYRPFGGVVDLGDSAARSASRHRMTKPSPH